MRESRTEAVIIARQPYSETSFTGSFYGRGSGRVSFIAKGARRLRSVMRGCVELFTWGEAVYLPSRSGGLANLIEFEAKEEFAGLRSDYPRFACASTAGELLLRGTAEEDPHEDLFLHLVSALTALDGGLEPFLAALGFAMRYLEASGVAPRLDRCVSCEKEATAISRPVLSLSRSGLVCRPCREEGEAAREITAQLVGVLRFAAGARWDRLGRLETNPKHARRLLGLICDYARFTLGLSLRSPAVLGLTSMAPTAVAGRRSGR